LLAVWANASLADADERAISVRRNAEKRSRLAVSPLPLECAPVVVSFHHVLLVHANLPFAGGGAVLRFGRFERPSLLA
jgi:hypothetical protein